MHPDDRVLVAVMSRPKDLILAREQGWYRVPQRAATPGIFYEYLALYFTAAFGEQGWAVHWYARLRGHELVTRRELLPDEPDHPHAGSLYYKLQLGPLQRREPPIVSLRWRRVSFIHTTWDRFQAAQEINDLFVEGGEFVDRLYHTLREAALAPERCYPVREAGSEYFADLAVPCREGTVTLDLVDAEPEGGICCTLRFTVEQLTADLPDCLHAIQAEVRRRGGVMPYPPRGT